MTKPIYVTGHKSPDTDSICSAISYAKFKELTGVDAIPVRAGEINKETAFALDYFKADLPKLVKSFYVPIKEVMENIPAISEKDSIEAVAKWFKTYDLPLAPVVTEEGSYVGAISLKKLGK